MIDFIMRGVRFFISLAMFSLCAGFWLTGYQMWVAAGSPITPVWAFLMAFGFVVQATALVIYSAVWEILES